MEDIINESTENFHNRLMKQYGENYKTKEYTKNSLAYCFLKNGGLNILDFQAYIGCLLFMGILHLPRLNNYWSTDIIYQNYLPKVMSKNFFKMISAVLHLPVSERNPFDEEEEETNEKTKKRKRKNNSLDESKIMEDEINDEDDIENFTENETKNQKNKNIKNKKEINMEDPRIKVQHFLDKIVANGKKLFKCGRDVTIDESMIHFEGRSSLIFYMPAKPTKWGFKLHCLVDSKSHYFYDFIFDPGQNYKNLIMFNEEISFTENIVLKLLESLKGKGHRVFFDSWYSSVSLVEKLTEKGFQVISTLRNNTKNLPPKSEFNKNSNNFAYCNEIGAMIQKFSDKKDVYFISNYDVALDDIRNIYNFQNRGVDKMNENMSFYNIERRTVKWWKKIFFFGIEVAITNAKILHDKFFNSYPGYDQLTFRKNLIMQLFSGYCRINFGESVPKNPGSIPQKYINCLHSISFVPEQNKYCVYCYQRTRKEIIAMYKCDQCNKVLHPQCFTEWHKKNVYSA